MTARRTRQPRSPPDLWSVQQPDDLGISSPQQQFARFPTVTHIPGVLSPTPQDASSFPSSYSSPKLAPSPYASPAFGTDSALNWRESEKKRPPRRRKDAEREALVRQAAVGTLIVVAVIAGVLFVLSRISFESPPPPYGGSSSTEVPVAAKQSALRSVLGRKAPSPSFRDNLDPLVRYVTSPQHGGFAHQTMSLYHLSYLASILDRTPLYAPFYIPQSGPHPQLLVPATQVFDFDRFKLQVNVTGMDWTEVRPLSDTAKLEQLGCWTSAETQRPELAERTQSMQEIGLDPSFYPLRVPTLASKPHERVNDLQSAYGFLAGFDSDTSAKEGLINQAVHTASVSTLSNNPHREPEAHLFCVDHSLFHTASVTAHLDQYEHTAFRAHGQQLHFTRELSEAAGDVVAFVIGHRGPFVAVHISSSTDCAKRDGVCSYSLQHYMAAVDRVRSLAGAAAGRKVTREQRHHIRALSVLVTTDISDLGFLGEITNLGWSLLDRSDMGVRQRVGAYAPDIIESVIHSLASAAVGTKDCSVSKLAALRVRAWKNGPAELV